LQNNVKLSNWVLSRKRKTTSNYTAWSKGGYKINIWNSTNIAISTLVQYFASRGSLDTESAAVQHVEFSSHCSDQI